MSKNNDKIQELETELSEVTQTVEYLISTLKHIYGTNVLQYIQTPGKGPANVRAMVHIKQKAKQALEKQGIVFAQDGKIIN